jgi:hypothetical protein
LTGLGIIKLKKLSDVSVPLIGVLLVIEEEIAVSGLSARAKVNSERITNRMKIERDLMVVPLSNSRMRITLNTESRTPE